MLYEERIIDTILQAIKDNQAYLTQRENLPQLAKLGYMYNTLWYGGRSASYDGVIPKIEQDGEFYDQCDDNPKYKIEMCRPESEEIENYIYDAWAMHVENGYGPGWEEFHQIMTTGSPLSDLDVKMLKPNKTFDEWVEVLTSPEYQYSSHYPDRRSVANHLLCVIGNGYGFKNGYVIREDGGAGQDLADYGDWKNAVFREDIQNVVDSIAKDPEVEKVLRHVGIKRAEHEAKELAEEIKVWGMSYREAQKSDKYKSIFSRSESKEAFEYYPICSYSKISMIDKDSHPSYIAAGVEICEYIIANPPQHKEGFNKYQKSQCDSQVKFAEKFLNKFKTLVL